MSCQAAQHQKISVPPQPASSRPGISKIQPNQLHLRCPGNLATPDTPDLVQVLLSIFQLLEFRAELLRLNWVGKSNCRQKNCEIPWSPPFLHHFMFTIVIWTPPKGCSIGLKWPTPITPQFVAECFLGVSHRKPVKKLHPWPQDCFPAVVWSSLARHQDQETLRNHSYRNHMIALASMKNWGAVCFFSLNHHSILVSYLLTLSSTGTMLIAIK